MEERVLKCIFGTTNLEYEFDFYSKFLCLLLYELLSFEQRQTNAFECILKLIISSDQFPALTDTFESDSADFDHEEEKIVFPDFQSNNNDDDEAK